YPHYLQIPRLWGISVLNDQAAAGAVMWVAGSAALLLPIAWIAYRLMHAEPARVRSLPVIQPRRVSSQTPWNLLDMPAIGPFLRWRHARIALQLPMVLLSIAIVADGVSGPRVAPMNLAGTIPWIHWRGLVVLGLLLVGNVFCMACPFTLPRRLLG